MSLVALLCFIMIVAITMVDAACQGGATVPEDACANSLPHLAVSLGPCDIQMNKKDATETPTVTWTGASASSTYTLLMVDPDARSRDNPIFKYVLHWMVADISGSQLMPGNGQISGREIAAFRPPGPPENTSFHRYQFFLYDQGDKNITNIQGGRARFNVTQFMDNNDLCTLLATYQFQASFDYEGCPGGATVPEDACTNGFPRLATSFGACDIKMNKKDATDKPTVTWEGASADSNYTLLMVDPDARSRANPTVKYVLHWMVTDVQGSQLMPGNGQISGTDIADYRPPGPPEGTGFHRYQFLLYDQGDKNIVNSHAGGARFNVTQFMDNNTLCTLLATYQFQASFDYAPVSSAVISSSVAWFVLLAVTPFVMFMDV